MTGTQCYIGIKNGVVVCVNRYTGFDLGGEFYHGYSTEPVRFVSAGELLTKLENLFDMLNFPHAATNSRDFDDAPSGKGRRRPNRVERPYVIRRNDTEERVKVMSDKDILNRHGDEGTFIVRVQQRQNSSWQGRITWVDEDKTVYFRSVWEMMKLIDAALSKNDPESSEEAGNWA